MSPRQPAADPTHRNDSITLVSVAVLILAAMALLQPNCHPQINVMVRDISLSRDGAPLPQARDRATVPAMPTGQPVESAVFHPGDRVSTAGVYFPFGKIARRVPTEGVATGLIVAHEAHFEIGELLPELTGYEVGAVWVREAGQDR